MLLVGAPVVAAVPSYENDVRPILEARCGTCHASSKRTAKLNLVTLAGIARGGLSGAVVEPGDVEKSYLWQRISADEMPPETPLSDDEKAVIREWIAGGAPELPRLSDAERWDGSDHWSFHPPRKSAPPAVADESQIRTEIDRFIAAKLAERGLKLAGETDRATLIRRVSFDLTGLPPSPEDIALYLSDGAPGAYDRMVDRYLASPDYGVRWGKYWLDAAGYADSNGYFNADSDRPLAWRYRDWVVDSTNADLPWDRFLTEQIAGDVLAGYTPGGDLTPEMVGPLVATHFLRNSPDGSGESDGNDDEVRIDRMTVVEGTVNMWGAALLGLTLQCAKCHDHKFEPVTQLEYYRLQAILFPTYSPDQWQKPKERVAAVGTVMEREAHRAANEAIDGRVAALEKDLVEAGEPFRAQVREERIAELESAVAEALRAALAAAEDARNEDQKKLLDEHKKLLEIDDKRLAKAYPEFAEKRKQVHAAIDAANAERPAPLEELAIFGERADVTAEHHVSLMGIHNDPGEVAPPGVPAALCSTENEYRPTDDSGAARRVEFARWLTSPSHPMTARIAANRIWQNHFGRGLVETSENLGYTGATPSHPELLDWLAVTFVERGWSVKELHRLILRSAVYRQSSAPRGECAAVDPDNRLLGHFPLRRLDAEALRDAMLAAAGQLDATRGGPYVPSERVDGDVRVAAETPGALRRSIYLMQRRTQTVSMLEVFDAPSIVASCTRRPQATVPLQSLALLNADFVRAAAAELARRVDDAPSRGQRIELAFLYTVGRGPRDAERAAAERFFAEYPPSEQREDAKVDPALHDFCQMLLASNAFLYVE